MTWWRRAQAAAANHLTAHPLAVGILHCHVPNTLPVEVWINRGPVRTQASGAHVIAFLSPGGVEQITPIASPPDGRTTFHNLPVSANYAVYGWIPETNIESFVSMGSPPQPLAVVQPVNVANGNNPLVTLDLRPIPRMVEVRIRLRYTDPEGNARDFPQGMPVRVEHPDGSTQDLNLLANGLLTFTCEAGKRSFTLSFQSGAPHYVVVEPRAGVLKAEYRDLAAADNQMTAGDRAFLLPPAFDLRTSDWATASPRYANGSFDGLDDLAADFGAAPSPPIVLTLDPHWFFTRFQFFDRQYGRTHHHRRISTPPVVLEARRTNPAVANPDTRGNWTIGVDAASLVQALPWIVQRNAGLALPAVDHTMELCFRTDQANITVVYSQDQNTRLVQNLAPNAPQLQPGPDRLRYYDLPRVWRSRRYFTRIAAASPPSPPGKFFQDLTAVDIAGANNAATPLTFCLDDIVLYRRGAASPPGSIEPLPPIASPPAPLDRFAVLCHTFDNTVGLCSRLGVYKDIVELRIAGGAVGPYNPPGGPVGLPSSQITIRDNYINDYPDWTRLLIGQANLFDVFDKRTPDHAGPNRVVGARAAVRWVDATPAGVGIAAGNALAPRPARRSSPSGAFSIQPYFEQRHPARFQPYNAIQHEGIGRHDIVLLRCCDVDGNREVAVNLHYFRYHLRAGVLSPPLAIPLAEYITRCVTNVALRWNGALDAYSTAEGALLPVNPVNPIRARVRWFIQHMPIPQAHLNIQIVNVARAWMNGSNGTGELGPAYYQVNAIAGGPGRFSAAHESGHNYSLADEYGEKWNRVLLPAQGLPRQHPRQSVRGRRRRDDVQQPRVRARYFWHAAEWVRSTPGLDFDWRAAHDPGFQSYALPRHPQTPNRTHLTWPIGFRTNQAHGAFGRFDMLLYTLGRDHLREQVLPALTPRAGDPVDGVLMIVIRIEVRTNLAIEAQLQNLTARLEQGIHRRFNSNPGFHGWMVHGDINVGSPPQAVHFDRCMVKFAPRFLLTTLAGGPIVNPGTGNQYFPNVVASPPQSKEAWVRLRIPPHFVATVERVPAQSPPVPPVHAWASPPAAPQRLTFQFGPDDPAGRPDDHQLLLDFPVELRRMLGLAGAPTAVNLRPIMRYLIPNARVYGGNLASPP